MTPAFQREKIQLRLNSLSGKRVLFRSDYAKDSVPLQSLGELVAPYQVHEFGSSPRERLVVAIDSSCVLIGETDEGSIFAGRVAIVQSNNSKILNYYRAGPMIFYLDPASIQADLGSRVSNKVMRLLMRDHALAERFIRIRLERAAQLEVSRFCSDSIILIDGSLRSSILEPKSLTLKELERTAEENFNQILGISKGSSLKLISKTATFLQSMKKGSIYLDITELVRALIPGVESKVLLAKFSQNSHVFRVDSSYKNAEDESQVLSDLKFNDLLFRGYPETLRLAHHLSVFDASTISSVRSYLSSKYGIIQVPSDDLRATILGKLV